MNKKKKLALYIKNKDLINRIKKIINSIHVSIEISIIQDSDNIEVINTKHIDYVLIDQEIEEENFQEVLHKINQYPHVVRILIAEKWTQELVIQSNLLVHLILEKSELEYELKSLLQRAYRMSNLLKEDELVKMVNSFDKLPTLKNNYLEILHHLKSSDGSMKRVAELIENDIVLSAKVLQISNMSVYARTSKVASVKQAVVYLGMNILRALIVHIQTFSFKGENSHVYSYLSMLEKHSMQVAEYSRAFAEALNMSRTVQDDSFTAGLLHDIGKFILVNKHEKWHNINRTAHENNIQVYQAEEQELKTTHAEIGGYLLGIWGFSAEIIDAVVYHHQPMKQDEREISATTFVHIAEALITRDKINEVDVFLKKLDIEYLESLYIKNQILGAFNEMTSSEVNE